MRRPEGVLGLPGGLVGPRETAAETATRKLREKTGVDRIYLEQLETFTAPDRDPRGWIPTIAHLALVPATIQLDDSLAQWADAYGPPELPYDHNQILATAIDRVRGKLWWSNVAVGILPESFTLAQARAVYEAIAGIAYDPSTFSRDLRGTGLIEPTGDKERRTLGRPAALYRFIDATPSWGAGRRKRLPAGG